MKPCDEDRWEQVINEWRRCTKTPKPKVQEEGQGRASSCGGGRSAARMCCAWVTLTSAEVGLDHPCKLSERAEKSNSRSCDDLKTVRGGLQCDGQV